MLLYLLLILTVCMLSLMCFNKYTKNSSSAKTLKIIFLSASFLIMFAYSVMRTNIGYDYRMYAKGFSVMGAEGFSSIMYLDWEFGFNIFTKIIYIFTKDVRVYMAIIAAVCLAGPFYVIFRHSKNVWLSVLVYINLYFFYCTMNFLRQSMAISIVLFAYTFLIDRKLWHYTMLILIAAMFHSTVLILLPVYFIINFKPSLRIPLLYAYLVLWVFISSNATLDLITEYVHSEYRESVFLTRGLGIIHAVIPTIILGFGVFLLLKFVKPKNIAESDRNIIVQTNLMYFSYFWILVMLRHALFERFSYYTYVLVILYIPELIAFADEKYKDYLNRKFNTELKSREVTETEQKSLIAKYKRNRKILNIAITALVILITVSYNIYGLTAYARGVHGIYPYTSWLM